MAVESVCALLEFRLTQLSAVETYLQDFHQRIVGSTTAAFGSLPATVDGAIYPSSYHLLAAHVPETSNALAVFDLACGDGHLLKLLADRRQTGLTLIGADMSLGELNAARAQLPREIALLQERGQSLSIETGTIDVVLCHMAIMLMDQVDQVLSEIHRILRPSGTFAFIVGRIFLLGEVKKVYMDAYRTLAKDDTTPLRFGDSRTQSEAGWDALLASSFMEVRCQDVDLEWHPQPAELWESLSTTYDIDRLSLAARGALRERFFHALVDLQHSDGTLSTGWGVRLVSGRKR